MMDPSFQRKSLSRSVRKPQIRSAKTAKSDTRLLDAEQFLLPTYKRQPVVMTHGRGAYVYDASGKKYLDFLGGIAVNALGHAHPRIVKVIRREAARAIHLSNLYHNAFQGPLARKLAAWSGLDRAFFSNSGTEAIDGAMKLARLYGRQPDEPAGTAAKKQRFLDLENSFHGRTFGAKSAPMKRIFQGQKPLFLRGCAGRFVRLAPIKARKLHRAIDRFGAAIGKEHAIEPRPCRKFARQGTLKGVVIEV